MTSGLGTTSYSYDSNYQLIDATYPNAAPFNGEVHGWTYDNIGNRLTNTVNASTANYTYFKNGSNPLNGQRLQSDGTKTYTYDANGNVTGDGTYTYTWDYENRMTGITGGGLTATYTYDYEGRRKSKTINGVTTTYLYNGRDLIREASATPADFVFGPAIDEPLAQNRGAAISYYDVDGLGSTTALDDPAGTTQNSYTYDAWGVLRDQTGSTANPFGYTSREFGEAGMQFYRARYYNAAVGRFVTEDPLTQPLLQVVDQIDYEVYRLPVYAYTGNSPVMFSDPLGLMQFNLECVKNCREKFRNDKKRCVYDVRNQTGGACIIVAGAGAGLAYSFAWNPIALTCAGGAYIICSQYKDEIEDLCFFNSEGNFSRCMKSCTCPKGSNNNCSNFPGPDVPDNFPYFK